LFKRLKNDFFRHEKPTDPDDPLSNQNIRDRFYGVNDPVADKLLSRYKELPQLETPEDKTVTTLYIGNVIDMDEQQLRFVCLFDKNSFFYLSLLLVIIFINMEKFVRSLLYLNNHVHLFNLLNVMQLNVQRKNHSIN
jgi:hypothetical protein